MMPFDIGIQIGLFLCSDLRSQSIWFSPVPHCCTCDVWILPLLILQTLREIYAIMELCIQPEGGRGNFINTNFPVYFSSYFNYVDDQLSMFTAFIDGSNRAVMSKRLYIYKFTSIQYYRSCPGSSCYLAYQ